MFSTANLSLSFNSLDSNFLYIIAQYKLNSNFKKMRPCNLSFLIRSQRMVKEHKDSWITSITKTCLLQPTSMFLAPHHAKQSRRYEICCSCCRHLYFEAALADRPMRSSHAVHLANCIWLVESNSRKREHGIRIDFASYISSMVLHLNGPKLLRRRPLT